MMSYSINKVLNFAYKSLLSSKLKNSKIEAEILLCHVLRKDLKYLILNPDYILDNEKSALYKNLINRRKLNEPVAYILKRKEFWKNNFYVDKNVLIPRPDTEILIQETLKLVKKYQNKKILDIGTGSGCLIISILKELHNVKGVAIDVSKKALKVAEINAKLHHLENRIKFYKSSVDNFYKGKYDLIVSNPPYINNLSIKYLAKDIVNYEPMVALRGGLDGSLLLYKVIKKSSSLLKVGGKLLLEIGFDQKFKAMKQLRASNFYVNKIVKDYNNIDRCIVSTKK